MIARLSGKVEDVREQQIVLDVQGVGYLLAVNESSAYTEGVSVSLYTYLAVRETALELYGFPTYEEFSMFEHLIKLPKIGPKTGMQILSQASIDTLRKAAATEDPSYLSKVSGIGKKSAEKIVHGLKEMLGDSLADIEVSTESSDSDVVETLLTLGYSQKDAITASQNIPQDITETAARVKHALKHLSS